MTFPIVAASLGAFLIIFQMILMLNVGMHRFSTMIGVGVGEDLNLERKMRRHGNLAENAAIFTVVLAFIEAYGAAPLAVSGLAGLFAVARLCHALGFMSLSGSHNPGSNRFFLVMRSGGAFGTAFAGLGAGGYLAFLLSTAG